VQRPGTSWIARLDRIVTAMLIFAQLDTIKLYIYIDTLSMGRSVSITRAGREVFHQLQFERNVNIWPNNSGLTSWKNCWFNRYALGISRLRRIVSS